MCGIIAVVRRRSTRTPPSADDILDPLAAVFALLDTDLSDATLEQLLEQASVMLDEVASRLAGVPGTYALLASPDVRAAVLAHCREIGSALRAIDAHLDSTQLDLDGLQLERVNAALVRAKDLRWTIAEDRVRAAEAVGDLLNGTSGYAAVETFASIQTALSAIDRLEVRGRDSAGLHVLVRGHGLDLDATGVRALLDERSSDSLFRSGTVRQTEGGLSFVYKAAAEIGELGDNTRALRAAITADELLHLAVAADTAEACVLGHTRWASVGITFASVVTSAAMRSPSADLRSAKLSTSPLSAPITYGPLRPYSSEFSGCAFASEMIPTLAHRVWPSTHASAVSAATARWSSSSAVMAARSARVLSPSSPISAAAL